MIDMVLPLPPSLNNYWRHVGNKVLLSAGGRKYRQHICSTLMSQGVEKLDGRLRLSVRVYPPDRRRRDLDNILKALLDALEHGGLYNDDSQIDTLLIQRENMMDGGMVRVNVQEINRG